jgi:hypothetical protein
MPSSGILCSVALVRTDVSEECIASIIRVTRIAFLRVVLQLLVTANVVPSSPILLTLMMEPIRSSERSVLTGATRLIPEDGILNNINYNYRIQHIHVFATFLIAMYHFQYLSLSQRSIQKMFPVTGKSHVQHRTSLLYAILLMVYPTISAFKYYK